MIIREHETGFVMIEQHHHGHISANIIKKWQDVLFDRDLMHESVLYAIRHHDCGWRFFDDQAFWNDAAQSPYSFTDFPTPPKFVLYTHGVNELEAVDPYAASLCSAHYTNFMKKNTAEEAIKFVTQEQERRENIKSVMGLEAFRNFDKHLGILQFADNISLYICLNEPGVAKEQEHYFFREGIPLAKDVGLGLGGKVNAYWQDKHTVILDNMPSVPSFTVTLQSKNVMKKAIQKVGLQKAYDTAPYGEDEIRFQVLTRA